eukprot:1424483-Amphidinium_carterae.1
MLTRASEDFAAWLAGAQPEATDKSSSTTAKAEPAKDEDKLKKQPEDLLPTVLNGPDQQRDEGRVNVLVAGEFEGAGNCRPATPATAKHRHTGRMMTPDHKLDRKPPS